MPDPTPLAQGTEQTPQVVPTGTEPSAPPVADANRSAIYEKYGKLYGEPQSTEPTPPEPASPQPTSVAPAAPDLAGTLQSLVAKITELEGKLNAQPQAPQAVVPPVISAEEAKDWLAVLASGDKIEGEKLMANKVKALIGNDLQSAAVQQAVAQITAQQEINSFTADLRVKHPDILPMEQYIGQAAAQRIEAAQRAGKITSPADYVKVYKEAIVAEIDNARNLILTLRGEGKREGATRVAEVLASPNLVPNAVNTQRETPKGPAEPEVESAQSYMEKRQLTAMRNKNMISTN